MTRPHARAIVMAVTHFNDSKKLADVSKGLGEPMRGLDIGEIPVEQLLQVR